MEDLENLFPFNQAKAWEQQDALHNLNPDRRRGFRLPDTIRVERLVPEGERVHQFAEITPDQALHGIEWSMAHIIPQFMNRIVNQWEAKTSANNGRIIFRYFADCVTGKASTIWNAVVNEHARDDASKTFEIWQTCYLQVLH